MYSLLANFLHKKFRVDAHYFLKGGFWLSIGQVMTIGFGLISTALFAYFLSPNDYGVYRYLVGIAAILSSFSLAGLGQSILQTAAKKYDGFYTATLKINFIYSLAIVLAGLIGAGYYYLQGNTLLATGCLLIAILQPLTNTFQNTSSLLQGSQRFRESTILHTVRMLFITLVSVLTLFLTKSILALFFSYLASNLLANIFSHLFYKPNSRTVPSDILKKYLDYAKHTSFRNIILSVSQRADTIIIFTQLGAVELAMYSVATVIPEQIKGSFKNLASLLLPKYSRESNGENIKKSIPKRSLQLGLILIAAAVIYIAAAPILFKIIFPKYLSTVLSSQIFALSFPAMIAMLPTSFMEANLKNKDLYATNIIISISTVLLTFVGVTLYGLMGAIVAKVFQRYISTLLIYVIFFKKRNLFFNKR